MLSLYFSVIIILVIYILGSHFFGIKKIKQLNALKLEKEEIDAERQMIENDEQESINLVTEQIKAIDQELTERVKEVQLMNTVTFECPCNHNVIATFIDLSKEENTFICPECKNEYRIQISMIPILKGRIIDEHNMYNLLTTKYNDSKNPFNLTNK